MPGLSRRARRRARVALAWALPQAGLAVVVALAWWVLAPGGRAGIGEGFLPLVEGPGVRDAWFAVLAAAAGAAVGVAWVGRRPPSPDSRSVAALVGALVGATLAAPLALGLGLALDGAVSLLDGAPALGGTTPSPFPAGLRLDSPAALAVQPLAVALLVLVDAVRDLVASSLARSGPGLARGTRRRHRSAAGVPSWRGRVRDDEAT